MKRNGEPHVNLCWAGFDGDEIVFASFFDAKRAARVRRDPRVTLSFQAKEYDGSALYPYLVIEGRATVTDGGAFAVMDHLAQWYIGPGATYPEPRDAAGLDVPRLDRQDLRPGPVERSLGRDGPSPERPRSLAGRCGGPAAKAAPIKATSRALLQRRTSFDRRLGRSRSGIEEQLDDGHRDVGSPHRQLERQRAFGLSARMDRPGVRARRQGDEADFGPSLSSCAYATLPARPGRWTCSNGQANRWR